MDVHTCVCGLHGAECVSVPGMEGSRISQPDSRGSAGWEAATAADGVMEGGNRFSFRTAAVGVGYWPAPGDWAVKPDVIYFSPPEIHHCSSIFNYANLFFFHPKMNTDVAVRSTRLFCVAAAAWVAKTGRAFTKKKKKYSWLWMLLCPIQSV